MLNATDLKNGVVVHAKQGQREQYQPIKSILTKNTDIYSVLHGFLQIYVFDTFLLIDNKNTNLLIALEMSV